MLRADLAIVGAGTAGAALALFAARAGLRVVCLERRALSDAGARWLNGVPGWAFDAAGLARPRGDELVGAGHAFHLLAGRGPTRIVVRDHDLLEVDMRHLVARLQELAREAGAMLVERARVTALRAGELSTSAGPVRAEHVVDASGLAGARLLEQPRVVATDLCAAAQEVRAVRDRRVALDFFERHGVSPGETLCFTGVAGGFSVLNLRLIGDRLSLLTGSIPAEGQPAGGEIAARFVAEQPFIGERLFGGARAIPLRRPLDRIAHGRVALLGDSACQVFSAHGSGIGAGLVAARMLAETLAAGEDLHAYATRWHRRFGGLFAGYDAFRRFSQRLTASDIEALMRSGMIAPDGTRAALAQQLPPRDPRLLARALRGVARGPRLSLSLAGALARMAGAHALYARYPDDPGALGAWSERAGRWLD